MNSLNEGRLHMINASPHKCIYEVNINAYNKCVT